VGFNPYLNNNKNMKVSNMRSQDHDVSIDRKSKWGNPIKIPRDGDRAEVLAKYRTWITEGEGRHLLNDLHELKGQTLGCHCAPLACHGDVLIELIEAAEHQRG
jgi:Domain of unknown function (DUF4326)